MPANVLIDRAPAAQQHAASSSNGQHTTASTASNLADPVFLPTAAELDASAPILARPSNNASFQPPTAAHQLALDLAKLASNLNIVDGTTTASNGAMPTPLSSSSSCTGGGNASPVLGRATAGGVVASLLSDMSGSAAMTSSGRKSANMTECVPVPSSEHVAEIVGRQGSIMYWTLCRHFVLMSAALTKILALLDIHYLA